jgi:hypothetical protein
MWCFVFWVIRKGYSKKLKTFLIIKTLSTLTDLRAFSIPSLAAIVTNQRVLSNKSSKPDKIFVRNFVRFFLRVILRVILRVLRFVLPHNSLKIISFSFRQLLLRQLTKRQPMALPAGRAATMTFEVGRSSETRRRPQPPSQVRTLPVVINAQ